MKNTTPKAQIAPTLLPPQTAPAPVPTRVNIKTGSLVLDRVLQNSGAHAGQILHLFGGQPNVQLAVLLGLCKAAGDSGRSSIFFDLSGKLNSQIIERTGLSPYYNESQPDDPHALFRVLCPKTPVEVDEALHALEEEMVSPTLVVIDGLPQLLLQRYGDVRSQKQRDEKAGRVLYRQIRKVRFVMDKVDFTLWIAHSPLAPTNITNTSILPASLQRTIANTLGNYCNYGVELGRAERLEEWDKYLAFKASVWRLRTFMAGPRTIHLWNNGQFKN